MSGVINSGPALKSNQQGTIASVTSATATISSVDTTNTILFDAGVSTPNVDGLAARGWTKLVLTNATTVTNSKTDNVSTVTVSYAALEFYPGFLKSMQRGTITMSSAASNTATITSVDTTKAWPVFSGFDTTANDNEGIAKTALTNATTVTASQGTATPTTTIVPYQIPELYA